MIDPVVEFLHRIFVAQIENRFRRSHQLFERFFADFLGTAPCNKTRRNVKHIVDRRWIINRLKKLLAKQQRELLLKLLGEVHRDRRSILQAGMRHKSIDPI